MTAPAKLRVSANRRHLEYTDGRPFFYLGDTAWELFHYLNREDIDLYMENRARKGFSVIQSVILSTSDAAGKDGLHVGNAYGKTPLHDLDPSRPNDAYFEHVDYAVEKAESHGLFMGILPAWGHTWRMTAHEKPGIFNPEKARKYGQYLGRRYKGRQVIWILGGDRNINNEQERKNIESLAAGLREGGEKNHLISFHPRGPGQSSDWLHSADWLDFNMSQSSHPAFDHDNGLFAEHDYALDPPKPTIDGEPRYETIQVGFYFKGISRYQRFTDYDARQAAYWSLLAGACGHTYGANSVWQMWQEGRDPLFGPCGDWREAIDYPGAFQMRILRRLFESREWWKLIPDQSIIVEGPTSGGAKIRAARAADGSFAFVYSPRGESFTVQLNVIHPHRVKAAWFDPRYGIIDPTLDCDSPGMMTFTPPTSGRGCDWILILDDPTRSPAKA